MTKKLSRAEKAGRRMGRSIVTYLHLFYQLDTARNYLSGVLYVLEKARQEFTRR